MTRGNFVLIEDGRVYMSIQFNGDMYPDYNGKFVYHLLKHLDSKGELKKAIKQFDEVRFGYSHYGTNVTVLEEMEDLDFSRDYYSRFNSDYLYVKNADKNPFSITDINGKHYIINPDEIQIWRFGKYEEPNFEELKMTQENLKEINGEDELNGGYTYYAESDEAEIIKLALNDIKACMESKMKETPFEVDDIMYSNGTFSIKHHSVGPEDPNFAYKDIWVFWGKSMNDDFVVKTKEKLSLHDIVRMIKDCAKSLK